MSGTNRRASWTTRTLAGALLTALAGCHSSSGNPPSPPTPDPAPDPITLGGFVSDGPVTGGSIHAFRAADIATALESAADAGDRGAALAAAGPVASVSRSAADEDAYTLEVGGELAGETLFLVFDNAGADDEAFGDSPPNLESVVVLGSAGTGQTVNVSLHTTLIAQIVRAGLDPDGDGTPIDAAAAGAVIQAAELDVLDTFGRDDGGEELFSGGRPLDTTDAEDLHTASSLLGLEFRSAAALEDLTVGEIIAATAADLADGVLDGMVGAAHGSDVADTAARFRELYRRDGADDFDVLALGPCSSSTVTLRRACAADRIDDRLEGRAVCTDIADATERSECLDELSDEFMDSAGECDDVFEARLALCEAVSDAAHEPAFGPGFAAQFVDPREIGASVEPNPYFPLVPGTTWIYSGQSYDAEEDELVTEEVTVTVLDRIKLIGGIQCVVVNDVVVADDGTMEDTNDWLAQDVEGNVWYCGEISRDFEEFDGDEPVEFELVHTDGSWKHGRDGAEAGVLLPAAPDPGTTIRQEVLFGEAEDAIEILSVTGTETAPGGACAGNCLVTRDFTPLEPDAEENKYYAPGIGLIVEVDPETGDRLELIEFSQP